MDSTNPSRRKVLGTLGATSVAALAGCIGGDDDDVEGTLRVGILQDYSALLPEYGAQGTAGFYSGLAFKAGEDPLPADAVDEGEYEYAIDDIDIDIIARDTEFSASEAQEQAEDLVIDEDVDLLYGVGNSGGASAVITQVVDDADIPYIMGPAASAELTASEATCREQVFRANENTAMDARSGGVYIAEQTNVEQIALFGADDEFGQSVVNNYRTVLENRGVDVVLERAVPDDFAEWGGLLGEAQDAGAEAIVGGFTAAGLIPFGTAFLQDDIDLRLFGGFASRVTLGPVGATLAETLGESFTDDGIDAANFGPFTTRYHWNQYDNEINDEFVEKHADTYGIVPDLFTSGAFTAASAVIQAIQEEGEISGDAIVSGMRGMTVEDTPKGEDAYVFQEYNNQARSEMTVAPVTVTPDDQENWESPIMPGEPLERIPADEVTRPSDDVTCSL